MSNYYIERKDLVNYIMYKHKKDTGLYISPIKLQKSLYLLYAMWGGQAKNINRHIGREVELQEKLKVELFEGSFSPWLYGPVDEEVYENYKAGGYVPSRELKTSNRTSIVRGFVDEMLEEIFEISDFTLVDITREDYGYRVARERGEEIYSEDIINEYAKRTALR